MIVRSVDKSAHHKRLGAIQNIKPWCKIKKMKHMVKCKDKQKTLCMHFFAGADDDLCHLVSFVST